MAWAGRIEIKIFYICSVRKRKGKRPFEQLRCRWEDGSWKSGVCDGLICMGSILSSGY